MTSTFMTSVFLRHPHLWHQCFSDIHIYDISVFFRHDIYIHDISGFQTWQQHLWHQCYSDMTATFITSVFFRYDIYIYNISVVYRHDIYIYDISVFFTWHLHLWHQCFSDMTSTFMTWHVINVDVMSKKKKDWCYRCKCHVWKTLMSSM